MRALLPPYPLLLLLLQLALASLASASVQHSLTGRHFTIITVEDPPFITVRPNKRSGLSPTAEWDGWIVRIMKKVAERGNFTFNLRLYNSSYDEHTPQTGLVNTFSYGKADVALQSSGPDHLLFAGAYSTPSRIQASKMTVAYANHPLSLLVLKREPDIKYMAMLFARPFTVELWVTFMSLIFMSGLFFVLIEGAFVGNSTFRGVAFHSVKKFAEACGNSVYLSWTSVTGLNGWHPVTHAGRMYSAIWGFLIMVLIAAYTATAAAILVGENGVDAAQNPDTFNRFMSRKFKACVLGGSAYSKFLKTHVKHRYITQVPASGLFDMITKVSNYECDGIIERRLHLAYLEKAASAAADVHTYSLQKYEHELYSLGMTPGQFEELQGLQVVDVLGDGPQQLATMFSPSTDGQTVKDFSFLLTQLVSDGTIKDLYDEVVLANTGEVNNALVTQYPVPQINVYNFAGLYGILGAIAAILCIAEFIERCTSRGQSKNGMLETALKKFFGLGSNDDLGRLIREKDAYKGRRFANKAQLVKDVLDTYHDHASDAPGNDQKNLVLELQAPVYNYLKYQMKNQRDAANWEHYYDMTSGRKSATNSKKQSHSHSRRDPSHDDEAGNVAILQRVLDHFLAPVNKQGHLCEWRVYAAKGGGKLFADIDDTDDA